MFIAWNYFLIARYISVDRKLMMIVCFNRSLYYLFPKPTLKKSTSAIMEVTLPNQPKPNFISVLSPWCRNHLQAHRGIACSMRGEAQRVATGFRNQCPYKNTCRPKDILWVPHCQGSLVNLMEKCGFWLEEQCPTMMKSGWPRTDDGGIQL